jgi:hypothetical protein
MIAVLTNEGVDMVRHDRAGVTGVAMFADHGSEGSREE